MLNETTVETVVLLSQQKPDDHIEIEINLDEIDATSAETKATYKEIQDWVQEKYGFHVTNLNIAQVKQKHGIIERENKTRSFIPVVHPANGAWRQSRPLGCTKSYAVSPIKSFASCCPLITRRWIAKGY